ETRRAFDRRNLLRKPERGRESSSMEKAASGEVGQAASPEKRPGNDVERRSGGRAAPKWVRIDASPCLERRTERFGAPSLDERRPCVPGFVARRFRRPLRKSRERGIADGVPRGSSSPQLAHGPR